MRNIWICFDSYRVVSIDAKRESENKPFANGCGRVVLHINVMGWIGWVWIIFIEYLWAGYWVWSTFSLLISCVHAMQAEWGKICCRSRLMIRPTSIFEYTRLLSGGDRSFEYMCTQTSFLLPVRVRADPFHSLLFFLDKYRKKTLRQLWAN